MFTSAAEAVRKQMYKKRGPDAPAREGRLSTKLGRSDRTLVLQAATTVRGMVSSGFEP
jgi:hypothetical protein